MFTEIANLEPGMPLAFCKHALVVEYKHGKFYWLKLKLQDYLGSNEMIAFSEFPQVLDSIITERTVTKNLIMVTRAAGENGDFDSHAFNLQKRGTEWLRKDSAEQTWRKVADWKETSPYFWGSTF